MPVLELTDEQAVALLRELPAEQQQRVIARFAENKSPMKRPTFGGAKSDILYIAEDFDAPLEDSKEYTK